MDNKFDLKFSSIEEMERELDEILNVIQGEIENSERKVTVLNNLRMKQFQFTYAALLYLVRDKDVSLSYKLYEPFKTMGSISIEGECVEFNDVIQFTHAAEFASNIEVYPLAKNRVRMTFTFHGLTAPIE